jgi:hypothetical protein
MINKDEFIKGGFKNLLFYVVGLLIALITYMVTDNYTHGPNPTLIILTIVFIGGIARFIYYSVKLIIRKSLSYDLSGFIVNFLALTCFVILIYIQINKEIESYERVIVDEEVVIVE